MKRRSIRGLTIVLSSLLVGCSATEPDNAVTTQQKDAIKPNGPRIVATDSGSYRIDVESVVPATSLPTNADLKMADGDIVKYALKLCNLDFANKLRPDHCEVFVQSDKSGLLVGYVTLEQGSKVTIDTSLQTDHQRTGLGCWITGTLDNTDYEHPQAKLNLGENFEARMEYSAWEKSPNDWVVASGDDESKNAGAAIGVWYFKQENNKLRISQERWSYCYSDPKVFLDEVFVRLATLTRVDDQH